MGIPNRPLSKFKVSAAGTIKVSRCWFDAGRRVSYTVQIDEVTGSPTGVTVTPTFLLAPNVHNGFNLNAEANGQAKPFVAVNSAGNPFKGCIEEGDWAAIGGTSSLPTASAPLIDSRTLKVPSGMGEVQLQLAIAFTGGTSPSVALSVAIEQL